MATKISWTSETWNPVTGCSKVSPGCANCYAETLSLRFGWSKKPWLPENAAENVVLHPDRLGLPLRWRKPRRIFVNSMSDLFHERIPDEFISFVFAVMSMAPQHSFQILTKRPERMRDYLVEMATNPDAYVWAWAHEASNAFLDGAPAPPPVEVWPLPNVWLGVSVENQHWADQRIPLLLETPAAVRFVSAEPLLDAVDLTRALTRDCEDCDGTGEESAERDGMIEEVDCSSCHGQRRFRGLDWVIVGGESGPHHRSIDRDWVQSLRDQCRAAGVAYWGKQDAGSRPGIALPGELGDQEFPDG